MKTCLSVKKNVKKCETLGQNRGKRIKQLWKNVEKLWHKCGKKNMEKKQRVKKCEETMLGPREGRLHPNQSPAAFLSS